MIHVELTILERNALVMVLVHYALQHDSTKEWIDVVTDETVTLGDLLTKLEHGKYKGVVQ